MQGFLCQGTDEVHIVGDEDQCSFIMLQSLHQGFYGQKVQVGGRLVHQQEVGRIHQEFDQAEPRFFPAGKNADAFFHIQPPEQEGTQDGTRFFLPDFSAAFHDFLQHGIFRIQVFRSRLGEVADARRGTGSALSGVNGDDARQDFEKSGFARAVRAYKNSALPAFHQQVQVFINPAVAIGLADFFQLNDFLGAARRLGEVEFKYFPAGYRFLNDFHLFQLLDAALDLPGFGIDGAETVNKFLNVRYFLLLVAVGRLKLLEAHVLLLEEVRVIAAVFHQFFVVDVVHAFHQLIHEIPVVGNHQDGSGVVFQVSLEPQQGQEVQVVGRFVQHQEVRLQDKELGQVRAHDPAAGHFPGGAMEVAFPKGQPFENFLGFGLQLVTVGGVESVNGFRVFRRIRFVGVFRRPDGVDGLFHFRRDAQGDFQNGFILRFAGFLGKIAHDGVFIHADGAFVRRVFSQNHAEQGGFACSVGANQSHPFPPVNGHFRFPEQGPSGVGFCEIFDRQHGEERMYSTGMERGRQEPSGRRQAFLKGLLDFYV